MSGLRLFYGIGLSVTVWFIYMILTFVIIPKIKKIMNRQSKIRCLCKHEYTLKCRWLKGVTRDYDEYIFICRKCEKEKSINVYENEENKD